MAKICLNLEAGYSLDCVGNQQVFLLFFLLLRVYVVVCSLLVFYY